MPIVALLLVAAPALRMKEEIVGYALSYVIPRLVALTVSIVFPAPSLAPDTVYLSAVPEAQPSLPLTMYDTVYVKFGAVPLTVPKDRPEALSEKEQELLTQVSELRSKFESVMDDDFNTADAISVIFDLVRFSNSNADEHSSRAFLEALKKEIMTLADVCGLIVERKQELQDAEIEQLIADRQQARKDKNFARADEIRNELLDKGIVLEDTREGVKWKKA